MGKISRRHNWKSRQIINTVIDESEQKKIQVEFQNENEHYDSCNALVLPSAKRKTKVVKDKKAPVKLLTKKQRKKLEKISEKKKKILRREELLKELKKVQAKPKDMGGLISLSEVQTMGRKKFRNPSFLHGRDSNNAKSVVLSNGGSLANSRATNKKEKNLVTQALLKKRIKAPNVVETSSSSEDEDEEEDVNEDTQDNIENNNNTQLSENDKNGEVMSEESELSENDYKEQTTLRNDNKEKSLKELNGVGDSCEVNSDKYGKDVKYGNEGKVEEKWSNSQKRKSIENETESECSQRNKKLKRTEKSLMEILRDKKLEKMKNKMEKSVNEGTEESGDNDKKKKKKNKKKKKKKNKTESESSEEKKIENDLETMECNGVLDTESEPHKDEEGKENQMSQSKKTEVENLDIPKERDGNEEPKKMFKLVERDPEIQKERMKLPILSEEHAVMEAINENPVTIIVGPTGSGKTTQVPQFLYEAGYTSNGRMIGVTEPRRIAAMSMSQRIAYEMSLSPQVVSYQVRFEGNTTSQTEIKLMTDGILFQEVKEDKLLKRYSAIIIDEVHERTVHSDILLGLLSLVVRKRTKMGNPLKLIIMSATPRIEDFTQNEKLFRDPKPPIIEIPSRMFKVNVHFNRRTETDYCEAAFKKVCQIHRRLPEGGILVFLTGQQEITALCERLQRTFPYKEKEGEEEEEETKNKSFHERISEKKEKRNKLKKIKSVIVPEVNLDDFCSKPKDTPLKSGTVGGNITNPEESVQEENLSNEKEEDSIDGSLSSDEEEAPINFQAGSEQPLWVLPLYSILPSHKQKRVFKPPPEGTRLCVVSTNVAETTLTIPNIKYVVDSGKIKEKIYDPVTGVSTFHVLWTSKASATQRAGRAGRVCEGFCYCLYSSAVYNDEFPEYSIPDIQKRPLNDVLLVLKALRINVPTFPFPTPPDQIHLQESYKRLRILGALEENQNLLKKKTKLDHKNIDTHVITPLGLSMTCLAMLPRFAKIILSCKDHEDLLPYLVIIIAALTVREIFIEVPLDKKELHPDMQNWVKARIKWGGSGKEHMLGDPLVLIRAFLEAEKNKFKFSWCSNNGIRHSAMKEVMKLRKQLTEEINLNLEGADVPLAPDLNPPTEAQAVLLCEALVLGSVEQVARRVNAEELATVPKEQVKQWKNAYRTLHLDKPVYISSASVLHKDQPKYLIYQEIYESNKVYLRAITGVNEDWLLLYGGSMAELSPPLETPPPRFDQKADKVKCWRKGTFGPDQWSIGEIEVEFPLSSELFKWVAYFFLTGDFWPPLKPFVEYLYDPKVIIRPVTLRFREKKERLIQAFALREISSAKALEQEWKKNSNFLKKEYCEWFDTQDKVCTMDLVWPPLKEEKYMYI